VTLPADLSNWRSEPFNRWSFRNVGELIDCSAVDNAPQNAWPLPRNARPMDDFRLPLPDGSSLPLDAFLKATATDGLVILLDGRIVYDYYENGTSERAVHIIMSASKSVVGLIAGILQRSGVLDIDALVSTYVPEIAERAYGGVTIRHLLDMQSGVVLDEDQQLAYAAASNWNPVPPALAGVALHSFFEGLPPQNAVPGGPFSYVSANTDLLGWALERAAGRDFASLLSDVLWKPMGAVDPAYITVDRKGAPRCTGGLCATTLDFARVGQLLVQEGRRDSLEIVPKDWIDDIAENGDRDAWKNGEFGSRFGRLNMHYRSGWYVIDDEPKTLFAMGIHGQHLFVDRTNRLVIAKVSSQNEPTDLRALGLTFRAVPEIRRCLLG
jgi:CubicO group peptidase (beta-lactamase class C family)